MAKYGRLGQKIVYISKNIYQNDTAFCVLLDNANRGYNDLEVIASA
jgi:hypothetical protein